MAIHAEPDIMAPRERCWFTPILWEAKPELEDWEPDKWRALRARFAEARQGNFDRLDEILVDYVNLKNPATRVFARDLLGCAGTDAQLEMVERFVVDTPTDIDNVCDLCRSLGFWGRLSAVEPMLVAYDRNFPGQAAEGIPAYLTTMLESEFGNAANYPREDTIEAFETYARGVRELYQQRLAELGGPHAYAFFGGPFSVRRIAERFLELLGTSPYERMMQPYLRQRFEACTGVDCSDFYHDTDFQALTAAAKLEAWLSSSEPDRYIAGERYFFGHQIPRPPLRRGDQVWPGR